MKISNQLRIASFAALIGGAGMATYHWREASRMQKEQPALIEYQALDHAAKGLDNVLENYFQKDSTTEQTAGLNQAKAVLDARLSQLGQQGLGKESKILNEHYAKTVNYFLGGLLLTYILSAAGSVVYARELRKDLENKHGRIT